MPTTCGFPNCKFRSRYRGQEDNRHFYRIPKRPLVLRQRWLKAIGRTEETVVSQLRICSAHFEGGEKKEGDIPVPDPQLDVPLSITLPPKESKNSERRRCQKVYRYQTGGSSSSSTDTNFNGIIDRRPSVFPPSLQPDLSSIYPAPPSLPFNSDFLTNIGGVPRDEKESHQIDAAARYPTKSPNGFKFPPGFNVMFNFMARPGMKPLVALLDGRDCTVEMPLLKDIATVAFCDAQATSEIHEKVLNEAVAALMWNTIRLDRNDLVKFKALKVIVCLGGDTGNVNIQAASQLGIAVCNAPSACIDEVADSTISMILNLYRRTSFLNRVMEAGKPATGIEQIRDLANGTRRIKGSVLGVYGLGSYGGAVILRAKAFGFRIILFDPEAPEGAEKVYGIERVEQADNFFKQVDCVTLHCPLTGETEHLINEETLRLMKAGSFVVNTSRPELIHEPALVAALRSGHIKAAALDTQRLSDTNYAANFIASGQLVHTARTSWFSDESANELRVGAARELRRALTGQIPGDLKYCINADSIVIQNNSGAAITATPPPAVPPMNFPALNIPGLMNAMSAVSEAYYNPLMMNMNFNNPLFTANALGIPVPSLNLGPSTSRVTSQSPKTSSNQRTPSRTSTPAQKRNASRSASKSPAPSFAVPNGTARPASTHSTTSTAAPVEEKVVTPDDDLAETEAKRIKLVEPDSEFQPEVVVDANDEAH
uniref:THAP-type domain-containing protein n=1 Tax=Panagrellus redivivus TaxID=6233 RepID=A0A7E4VTT3_PANRE